MDWQLQDAKNQFSKLVQKARIEGPQEITVRGRRTAVVLSVHDYDALCGGQTTLIDTLLSGPPWDDEFVDAVATRAKMPNRDVAF